MKLNEAPIGAWLYNEITYNYNSFNKSSVYKKIEQTNNTITIQYFGGEKYILKYDGSYVGNPVIMLLSDKQRLELL